MSSLIDGATTRRVWESGSTTVSYKTAQSANQKSASAHLPTKSLFSNLFSRERKKPSVSSGESNPSTPSVAGAPAPASEEDVFAFM